MASLPIPAPAGPETSENPGPGPGGGFISPAPAVQDTGATHALQASLVIVSSARRLAEQYPQVTAEVRQINDLVSKMQMKIKGSQQPSEPQAPPV
jgi:hypothetical protein